MGLPPTQAGPRRHLGGYTHICIQVLLRKGGAGKPPPRVSSRSAGEGQEGQRGGESQWSWGQSSQGVWRTGQVACNLDPGHAPWRLSSAKGLTVLKPSALLGRPCCRQASGTCRTRRGHWAPSPSTQAPSPPAGPHLLPLLIPLLSRRSSTAPTTPCPSQPPRVLSCHPPHASGHRPELHLVYWSCGGQPGLPPRPQNRLIGDTAPEPHD